MEKAYTPETTEDFKHNLTKKVRDKVGRLYEVIADCKTTTYEYNGNGSRKSVTYSDRARLDLFIP